MRILVVEDEPKTGDYLRKGQAVSGFVVDRARNGHDGLRLATEGGVTADIDAIAPASGYFFANSSAGCIT